MPRGPKIELTGLDAQRDRARRFADRPERRFAQKPEAVVVTLQDDHAPEVTLLGSAHPTTVKASDGTVLADLKPGEGAEFKGEAHEDEHGARTVTWSRVSHVTA